MIVEVVMKIGDLVKVKENHWANPSAVGIIVETVFPSENNKSKAVRVMFPDGKVRPKLTKSLELVRTSRVLSESQ